MKKIAIITDSNSGITQKLAEELGVYVVPMPFTIDGKEFFEDITLTREQFYEKLDQNADISTSQSNPEALMELWSKVLKDHDEIVYIPMSSGLSGSCQTASVVAQEDEFDGKVFVVDNQRISVTQYQSVVDAIRLRDMGMSGAEIKQKLLDTKFDSSIYIMVDTLKYLKKGGRLTPAAALLGELLRIKPVLQIHGEKLDAFAKARTVSHAKTIMFNAIKSDAEKLLGGFDPENVILFVAHTCTDEVVETFINELKETYPGFEPIIAHPLSLSVTCHIGKGSLAVAVCKKI